MTGIAVCGANEIKMSKLVRAPKRDEVAKSGKLVMTYIGLLRGEDDDFEELRQVGDEIVDAGSFGCSPTILAL